MEQFYRKEKGTTVPKMKKFFNYPLSTGKSNYKKFFRINTKKIDVVISYFVNYLWNVGIHEKF